MSVELRGVTASLRRCDNLGNGGMGPDPERDHMQPGAYCFRAVEEFIPCQADRCTTHSASAHGKRSLFQLFPAQRYLLAKAITARPHHPYPAHPPPHTG